MVPTYQHSLFTTIRNTQEEQEQDDDNMTEMTSPTDDDDSGVLRDAFNVPRMFAEEDDEIVWDPR